MNKLTKISIKDLGKFGICPGHLFLQTSSDRQFYLLKPGFFVDEKFIKKYEKLTTDFELNSVVESKVQDEFFQTLKEFNYLSFEMDTREKCLDIIRMFKKVFSSDYHFLNFAIPCFQNFNKIPSAYIEFVSECDSNLLKKSIYSAAFSVIISLANGLYHPTVVQDIYNVTLALDFGLCSKNYSYCVAQACNRENKTPGSGQDWILKNGTQEELDVFLDHPYKSFNLFGDKKIKLKNKEMAQIALYQHELADGKGFPRGVHKGLISSWESVVILADHFVEIASEHDFENRVNDYIFNFESDKNKILPLNKVFQRLCHNLRGIDSNGEIVLNG